MRQLRGAIAVAVIATFVAAATPVLADPPSTRPLRFVVEFAGAADLEPAQRASTYASRGSAVVEALKETAARSQAGALEVVKSTPGASAESFWLRNTMVVDGDSALEARLRGMPGVASVRSERSFGLLEPMTSEDVIRTAAAAPEWGVAKIRADAAWGQGVTGSGIVVANIDTGVQYDHPALVRNYRGNNGNGTFTHDYNWWDPTGMCGPTPCDNNGHGTHTMGTIAGGDGTGSFTPDIGVAPGARWVAAKGCGSSSCSESNLLSAGQWVLAPTDTSGRNADTSRRPHVVGNSWGGGPGDPFYRDIVRAWRAAGIIPVFAAGNSGPGCSTGGSPGDYTESFSVGATDSSDNIASFSSRGPSQFGKGNPDVSAPGVSVRSAIPGSSYASYSGTSMATPHVAGAAALVLSANPSLVGNIDAVTNALRNSALNRVDTSCGGDSDGDPNNVYGDGRIDVAAAVALVANGGQANGRVTESGTGNPIAGATMTLADATRSTTATTGSDGRYTFNISAGTYTLTAAKYGYVQSQRTGVVVRTNEVTTVDFALSTSAQRTVSGRASWAGGAPAAGLNVTAVGTPVNPATTGADGRYSLQLPSGTYTLRFAGDACARVTDVQVTVGGSDVTRDVVVASKQDSAGYWCSRVPFDWVDATTPTGLTGDDVMASLALPFRFRLYGRVASSVYVSTNGFLTFDLPYNSWQPSAIPSAQPPNGAIYGLWQDLVVDGQARIETAVRGSSPGRVFVVEFTQMRRYGASGRVDFELKLWEDGRVDFLHRRSTDPALDGRGAVVGIENSLGTVALALVSREQTFTANSAMRLQACVDGSERTGTGCVPRRPQPPRDRRGHGRGRSARSVRATLGR